MPGFQSTAQPPPGTPSARRPPLRRSAPVPPAGTSPLRLRVRRRRAGRPRYCATSSWHPTLSPPFTTFFGCPRQALLAAPRGSPRPCAPCTFGPLAAAFACRWTPSRPPQPSPLHLAALSIAPAIGNLRFPGCHQAARGQPGPPSHPALRGGPTPVEPTLLCAFHHPQSRSPWGWILQLTRQHDCPPAPNRNTTPTSTDHPAPPPVSPWQVNLPPDPRRPVTRAPL